MNEKMLRVRGGSLSAIDDQIIIEGNVISNFAPEVDHLFCQPDTGTPVMVRVKLQHLSQCHTLDLKLNSSEKLSNQIINALPSCKIIGKTNHDVVDFFILEQLKDVKPTGRINLFFQQLGLHNLYDGRWVYVCGDTILGLNETDSFAISKNVAKAHLVWNPQVPMLHAVTEFCNTIARRPEVLMMVWANTIISSLRSMFTELGIPIQFSLYLQSTQGYGKTTTVRRFGLLYNDKDSHSYRLGDLDSCSTAAATIKLISEFRDQVVLVDDLAKSTDSTVHNKRKSLIAEILRFSANENARSKMISPHSSENRYCKAGVAFTGEIPLNSASDITRLVIVRLERKMQGGSEADRTLTATVFYHFLKWLLPRLDDARTGLLRKYEHFISTNHEQPRLESSLLLFSWAINLFYQFARDIGAITDGYKVSAMQATKNILNEIFQYQVELVKRIETPPPEGNLSWYILKGFQRGSFTLVKRKKIKSNRDCVFENEALCIRSDTLLQYVLSETPYADLTLKQLNKSLSKEGVLPDLQEKRSATKKINGKRYMELKMEVMKQSAMKY